MSMNQQNKEQEAMAALNNAYANLQAAGTTLNNAMKALQEVAQNFSLVIKEKDDKIKELQVNVITKDVPKEEKGKR
jgi:esterase/lipase